MDQRLNRFSINYVNNIPYLFKKGAVVGVVSDKLKIKPLAMTNLNQLENSSIPINRDVKLKLINNT
jgi:hypothetical protein